MNGENLAESIEQRLPSVQNAVYRGDTNSTHDLIDLFAGYIKVIALQNDMISGCSTFTEEEMEYMTDVAYDLLDAYREWERSQS